MNNKDNHPKTSTASFIACFKGSVADRIYLIFLLFACLLLWFFVNHQLNSGPPTAYVYHQQTLLAKYLLPTNENIIHVAAKGEIGISDVEISKLGIQFISSPCTTHHCTLAGHKSYAGSVIACVPNHIMVVIRGAKHTGAENISFDAISE
ncbi:MAG: NusG domain II-containing protein [Ghiorsea sp.]